MCVCFCAVIVLEFVFCRVCVERREKGMMRCAVLDFLACDMFACDMRLDFMI